MTYAHYQVKVVHVEVRIENVKEKLMCNRIMIALLISITILLASILYTLNSPPDFKGYYEEYEEDVYLEYAIRR